MVLKLWQGKRPVGRPKGSKRRSIVTQKRSQMPKKFTDLRSVMKAMTPKMSSQTTRRRGRYVRKESGKRR